MAIPVVYSITDALWVSLYLFRYRSQDNNSGVWRVEFSTGGEELHTVGSLSPYTVYDIQIATVNSVASSPYSLLLSVKTAPGGE